MKNNDWTIHNAKLLREGKLSEINLENIAEKIERMGKRKRIDLISLPKSLLEDCISRNIVLLSRVKPLHHRVASAKYSAAIFLPMA